MNIYWDFKIIADSSAGTSGVMQKIVDQLSLEVKSHEIKQYFKFTTQLYSLAIESKIDGRTHSLADVARLFSQLGTPIFEDLHSRDGVDCYEAMFDSRKQLAIIPEVFWARAYVEKRIPKA